MQFTFYNDPGHGWAKVSIAMLHALNIHRNISQYSYTKGAYAYLEEDMDLGVFVRAYRDHYGRDPKFVEKHTNRSSRIRSYDSYTA